MEGLMKYLFEIYVLSNVEIPEDITRHCDIKNFELTKSPFKIQKKVFDNGHSLEINETSVKAMCLDIGCGHYFLGKGIIYSERMEDAISILSNSLGTKLNKIGIKQYKTDSGGEWKIVREWDWDNLALKIFTFNETTNYHYFASDNKYFRRLTEIINK